MLFSFSLSFSLDLANIVLLAILRDRPKVPSLDLTGGGDLSGVFPGKAGEGMIGVAVGEGNEGLSKLRGTGGGRYIGALTRGLFSLPIDEFGDPLNALDSARRAGEEVGIGKDGRLGEEGVAEKSRSSLLKDSSNGEDNSGGRAASAPGGREGSVREVLIGGE